MKFARLLPFYDHGGEVVVLSGAAIAVSPLSLAMLWPLPLICCAAFGLGMTIEIMMVQWTVALARKIPPGKLARVSSYDALGSVMAMPVGALIAGPLAATLGVAATEYGAAALIVVVSLLALIPRDVRHMRAGDDRPSAELPASGQAGRPSVATAQ